MSVGRRGSGLKRSAGGRPLDRVARKIADDFARIMIEYGYSPDGVGSRVTQTAHRLGQQAKSRARMQPRESANPSAASERCSPTGQDDPFPLDTYSHILTLWHEDPEYCVGRFPRPIPARGPAPSIEALVNRLDERGNVDTALAYHLETQSIQQVGSDEYVPLTRIVSHRGHPATQNPHHLRMLGSIIKTFLHNASIKPTQRRWFQFAADNMDIPQDKLEAVHQEIEKAALAFLISQDLALLRYAESSGDVSARVPMTVGVCVTQGPIRKIASSIGRPGSKRPRKNAARG